jgi:hypothetical protein
MRAAVRQAGTNAIPLLLRMLRAKNSPLKVKLVALAERQHLVKIKYRLAKDWNSCGLLGFSVLRTNAQSAVPELIKIVDENISLDSQHYAIYSLGVMGSAAKEAVPSLLRWATNSNRYLRSSAVDVLDSINQKPPMRAAIPKF